MTMLLTAIAARIQALDSAPGAAADTRLWLERFLSWAGAEGCARYAVDPAAVLAADKVAAAGVRDAEPLPPLPNTTTWFEWTPSPGTRIGWLLEDDQADVIALLVSAVGDQVDVHPYAVRYQPYPDRQAGPEPRFSVLRLDRDGNLVPLEASGEEAARALRGLHEHIGTLVAMLRLIVTGAVKDIGTAAATGSGDASCRKLALATADMRS
ncbi:hypothetical protein [Azospirillum rugosum]|uniref:hypothetical protein n=1 Tax=Azospirillum rugosum TaxID=416170 RepID=UPI00362325D4